MIKLDRSSGDDKVVLDLGSQGNYGGSAYAMVVGKTGNIYASCRKDPDQDHVASVWKGENDKWTPLLHLESREQKGAGAETMAGPDANGWIYIPSYKIGDAGP